MLKAISFIENMWTPRIKHIVAALHKHMGRRGNWMQKVLPFVSAQGHKLTRCQCYVDET